MGEVNWGSTPVVLGERGVTMIVMSSMKELKIKRIEVLVLLWEFNWDAIASYLQLDATIKAARPQ